MSKPKQTMKGVTCKNGYWYARIDGDLKYCGKGDAGHKLAKAARMKWEVKQYENREITAGLRVKRVELKTVQDVSNWYMTLPSVQENRGYYKFLTWAKLKSACNKAGIVYGEKPRNEKGERIGIVFHCFRHTRTSKWVEMGFSYEVVRRATGHKSLEAYQQYVKLYPAVVMRLVENNKKSKRDKNEKKMAQSL